MNYGFKLDKKDKRWKRFKKQRKKRGFDDTETWNLFFSITKFVLPRLKRFKKVHNGHPALLTPEKWDEIIQLMIDGFEAVKRDAFHKKEECKKLDKGMALFKKYFMDLWW